jgi:hypothetical protein
MMEEASTNQLAKWDRIKTEIAEAKDISMLGKLNYSLEAIQKWAKQSRQSLETQNEIAEYRLRLNRKQGEWIEANIPEEGMLKQGDKFPVTKNSHGTLAEAGIDRNDSPKFRILARIPEAKFEAYLKEAKEDHREISTNDACQLWKNTIATKWTGDQENYTPAIYIEAARSVMGSIDCDPASNELAQETVKAKVYFTSETDGLKQDWHGNIFLNPPYSHPEVARFIDKLLTELARNSSQAILLTNNNTDTAFFHKAVSKAAAVCFTKGRINFYKATGERTQPTNGQVFYYFGDKPDKFHEYFSTFGIVMIKYGY